MNLRISTPNINQYKFTFKKSENNIQNNGLERTPKTDTFKMSVGYVNDIHGQTNNMIRILSGLEGDLKVSAGDNDIGDEKNKPVNTAVAKFLTMAGIRASALGNHELDTTQKDFIDTFSKYDGDILASNLQSHHLDAIDDEKGRADVENFVKKSIVVDVKGEKVGLIGAAPIDLKKRLAHADYHENIDIDVLEDTIEDIQDEIDDLKEQGINKIFLLSHLGNKTDKEIVKHIDGVDVIIGGHTHELIKDIKEGENLFYSPSGEPIIITEAGKDGKYFGKLNLTFDSNGVITEAQNNLAKSNFYHKNMVNQYIFDKILGKPEEVGFVKDAPLPPETLKEENPHANFMCDAMRMELGTDIALWNNGGARNYFKAGIVDTSDIKDIAPFSDRVTVAKVSEETLVNTFKHAIETTYKSQGNKPGLIAVSGLNYTVDSKLGKLVGMNFVDKNGNEHYINVEDPSKEQLYSVATDSFMMSSGADYDRLAPKDECEELPYNKDYITCEYIKHLDKPIIINQTGRINFINND